MMLRKSLGAVLLAAAGVAGTAAEPMVKDGDRLAIIGDSITEQKVYSGYLEAYVLASSGLKDVQVFSFGWGGDRAPGFAGRQESACEWFRPTVATSFFGMNDGNYRKFDDSTGKNYREGSEKIARFMKAKGVRFLAGSPGAVDSESFRQNPEKAAVYNQTLAELGKIGAEVAAANGARFADQHSLLMNSMAAAKAKLGTPERPYTVLGGDGVHPGANGQLLIAHGFLKGLGFTGAVGSIDLDYATGKATVSDGIKQLAGKPGSADFESVRYPFCFIGGSEQILPFASFNRELNRFILKVNNLPADRARVKFGNAEKTFTKAELAAGINLAEFIDNPFRDRFSRLLRAIRVKQDYETYIYKNYLQVKRQYEPFSEAEKAAFATLDKRPLERWNALEKAVRAEIKPVPFTVTVTPVR